VIKESKKRNKSRKTGMSIDSFIDPSESAVVGGKEKKR